MEFIITRVVAGPSSVGARSRRLVLPLRVRSRGPHVQLLADALAQLPVVWRSGHDVGDDPSLVARRVLVRADSAGASHWLAEECVDRSIELSLGYQIDERVRDGVICVPTGCWHPAVDADGQRRDGAEVVELVDLVNLDAWPTGHG